MSLIDDFRDVMNQSVSIAPFVSQGLYGPTYGTAVSSPCYTEEDNKVVVDLQGKEAVSTCQIFVDGAVTVAPMDKITYDSKTPVLLRLEKNFDEKGNMYAVVIYT